MIEIAEKNSLNYALDEKNLFNSQYDYCFFANYFQDAKKINAKTIFMDHGVGTKHCDYESALETFDIILVEGDYRFNSLNIDFPQFKNKIHKVGFSKLDSVINFEKNIRHEYIKRYSIDTNKQTILYAPTFFPSSIEKMSDSFPDDFKNYNIIVKPHYMSLERKRYKNQRKKFDKWDKYDNCVVCDVDEYSLIPFLNLADIMISDESSAIFEFTALDKPVILNRFLKLRWSYIFNPKKLFNRLDEGIDTYRNIGDNANTYKEMIEMVYENIENKNKFKKMRQQYTNDLCGTVDGKVSIRIYELILGLNNEKF
jgi:CDP-glycerol glycerophosphotransferase (TagB/SpsB family)